MHGAFEFSHTHPGVMHHWLENSNYLVVLGVPDEAALLQFHELAAPDDYNSEVLLVRLARPPVGSHHRAWTCHRRPEGEGLCLHGDASFQRERQMGHTVVELAGPDHERGGRVVEVGLPS